jgi:hypothetical protein
MRKVIDDPRREFLVRALSMSLFAGSGMAQLFQPGHAMGEIPRKLPDGRSIYQLEGKVSVDGKAADINTPIKPGSHIRTGRSSRVIFVVANDAFVLRSNSELRMESKSGLLIDSMRILSGRILSVFGKQDTNRSITTLTATIGIRGTGIYVESEPDKSYVCTCYGHTRIVATADPNVSRDIVSEHHDEPVYVLPKASGNKLIVPGPFINHTDSELALIEELVGRTTPYAYDSGAYQVPRKRSY